MIDLIPLLNVEDAPRSLGFYVDLLGLEIERIHAVEGETLWARLGRGSISLMINRSPARVDRGQRDRARSYDDVVLCFRVEDVEAMRRRLADAGCEPGPIASEDYGLREFTVRDPDGYEIAIQQPEG